jgi:hypothetical protein
MSARRAPDSGPDLNGNFGVFFLMNLYTAISTYIYTPVSFTKVFGKEASGLWNGPLRALRLLEFSALASICRCSRTSDPPFMIGAYAGRYERQALPIISSISVRQPNTSR